MAKSHAIATIKEVTKLAGKALLYVVIVLGTWLIMGLIGMAFENAPEWVTPIATFVLVWFVIFAILCVHRFV